MCKGSIRSGEPLSFYLSVWVVYRGPRDYPEDYVARRHVVAASVTSPTEDCFIGKNLEAVRRLISYQHPNLVRRPRDESDDATIVETWL